MPAASASAVAPVPSGLVDADTGQTVTSVAQPEWDEASTTSVIAAAEHAMGTFAQPGLDFDTWWSQLSPLLTPDAAIEYAYVDPANVPATKVTGSGVIINDDSAYVAIVEVPTDAGKYQIVCSRIDAGASWLVSRFTPVQEVG